MSQRHPIDVFFRRRLAKYDAGAPMHVWDKIQAYQRRRQLRRLYWLAGSASALALLIFLAYQTAIDSPSPTVAADKTVAGVVEKEHNQSPNTTEIAPLSTVSPQPAKPLQAVTAEDFFSKPPRATPASTARLSAAVKPAGGQPEVAVADVQTQKSPVESIVPNVDDEIAGDENTDVSLLQPVTYPAAALVNPDAPAAHVPEEDGGYRMTGPHVRAHAQWIAPLPPAKQAHSHLSAIPDWHPFKPSTGCRGLQWRKSHWGLEILGGPLAAYQGLSARTAEQGDYLSMRRNTERNRLSLGSQLRLVYQTPAGLRLRLGVQYLLMNQHFSYENPEIMEIRIVPQLGNNGEIIGSDTIYTPLLHNTNNRYQWINIPLLVGYEFKGHKLRLGVLAGPVFNVRFDASGEIIAPDSRLPATFGNSNASVALPAYRSHVGISWYGGLSASINLYGRYSLFSEAFVQHFQRSLTVADHPLRHQPWIGSLLLGLRTQL